MVNPQPGKSGTENEPETQRDTVNLTAEELRSISGGVFLNLEIDKHKEKKGHHSPQTPDDRKR